MAKPTKTLRKPAATALDDDEQRWLETLSKRDGLAPAQVLRLAFRRYAESEGVTGEPATLAGRLDGATAPIGHLA